MENFETSSCWVYKEIRFFVETAEIDAVNESTLDTQAIFEPLAKNYKTSPKWEKLEPIPVIKKSIRSSAELNEEFKLEHFNQYFGNSTKNLEDQANEVLSGISDLVNYINSFEDTSLNSLKP